MTSKKVPKRDTRSKKSIRRENLITLISESDGRRINSKQEYIVEKYRQRFPEDISMRQPALSKLLKDKDTFAYDEGFITLVDNTKKIEKIKKLFIENEITLGLIKHYVLHTKGNANNTLSTIIAMYPEQIIESKIVGNDIFLSIEYVYDYSNENNRRLDGSDVGAVFRYLDYEINEKK